MSAIKGASTTSLSVNPISNNTIYIYPNPAKDMLNVNVGSTSNIQLEILNIHGQVVQQSELFGGIAQIDISKLPKGLYVVQIDDGQQKTMKKLVKEFKMLS